MLRSILQYLTIIEDSGSFTKTLGRIVVCRDAEGRMKYHVGNSAVVFEIMHEGRRKMLKCYTRPKRNLDIIYKDNILKNELYCCMAGSGEWVDAILYDRIEGPTLDEAIREAAEKQDTGRLSSLACAFDRMASDMLGKEWAHGDLKPENIIVDTAGRIHLIDFDAMFLPSLAGCGSPEKGTAAYQHPQRTADDFDRHIDDYPIALISTALHALAAAPSLYREYGHTDGLILSPQKIADKTDEAFDTCLELFARKGLAIRYRITKLLRSYSLRLYGLRELIDATLREAEHDIINAKLCEEGGLWGYKADERMIIPPVFDSGFDFTEDLAAVCIAGYWHFIDMSGEVRIDCSQYDTVKPFRNGKAEVRKDGRKLSIDFTGCFEY